MEYRCRLGTPAGEIIEGVYVADSEARLRRELEEKGLYVLAIRQAGGLGLGGLALPRRRSMSTREFLVFNQELATLLKAGMPLVQSLDILRQRLPNPLFKAVLDDVYERVRGGSALSEAFEAQGDLFPGVYTATLFAGEKSGSLEQVLRRYVAYTKVLTAVRRRTISALVYPTILLVLSLVVVAIIMLKVVPEFAEFYQQFDRELPLSTRVIVTVSSFVSTYLPLIVVALVAGAAAFWFWLKQPGQRVRFDHMILGVPLAGSTVRKYSTSQAARTLSTLLGGGIPLVNALDISARAIGNQFMARELQVASQQVREGRALAAAMNERGQFPDVAIKMVEVGESTGALQDMLNSLADFYDEEIETGLGRFVTLVEPILLVTMGIVIAGLLLALYMPLFQLSSVVR
jgi:type IV pilus assembly protein PilC